MLRTNTDLYICIALSMPMLRSCLVTAMSHRKLVHLNWIFLAILCTTESPNESHYCTIFHLIACSFCHVTADLYCGKTGEFGNSKTFQHQIKQQYISSVAQWGKALLWSRETACCFLPPFCYRIAVKVVFKFVLLTLLEKITDNSSKYWHIRESWTSVLLKLASLPWFSCSFPVFLTVLWEFQPLYHCLNLCLLIIYCFTALKLSCSRAPAVLWSRKVFQLSL